MKTLRSVTAMSVWSRQLHREGATIGLVPTMGALHAGHRALIRAARRRCDAVVVSIFVNPAQFGPKEDFSKYPRQLRHDQAICRAEGAEVVFAPKTQSMYPAAFQTVVSVPDISRRWEGESRPTHFQGVATIVTKLLGLVQPEVVVFGQKDYQQVAVIQRLLDDLNVDCRIIVHPTVREADGLALSSRNVYLSPSQRHAAPVLYRSLQAGARAIYDGTRSSRHLIRMMTRVIARESAVRIDYLAVCDPVSLNPLSAVNGECVLLGAIRIGRIRLIDNLLISPSNSVSDQSDEDVVREPKRG